MNTLTASFFITIATVFGLLGLCISIVSLLIHWKRPEQHPDVSRVESELASVKASTIELYDRVEHWMKRDRVRKAREGQEPARDGPQEPVGGDPAARKADLRRKVFGRLRGVPGGAEQ